MPILKILNKKGLTMKEKRKLSFKNLEIRADNNDGKKYIEGIIPYNSRSVSMWGITEVIDRTAFSKTLKENAEIKAFWNHDDSLILGNTKSGTLVLDNTDDGLNCRCELPNTSYANDLYEIITRGDVTTMSFGFIPIKWQDTENGKLRTLKEVKLEEVSFGVTNPAYPETNSQTYMRGFKRMKIDYEKLNTLLEKEELTDDEIVELQDIVNSINSIIEKNKPQEEEEEAAEREEPSKEDTPESKDTSETAEEEEKEEIKKEILDLIDTLFEIEKETKEETKDENT
jgi:HK97 family phage prohead protease